MSTLGGKDHWGILVVGWDTTPAVLSPKVSKDLFSCLSFSPKAGVIFQHLVLQIYSIKTQKEKNKSNFSLKEGEGNVSLFLKLLPQQWDQCLHMCLTLISIQNYICANAKGFQTTGMLGFGLVLLFHLWFEMATVSILINLLGTSHPPRTKHMITFLFNVFKSLWTFFSQAK